MLVSSFFFLRFFRFFVALGLFVAACFGQSAPQNRYLAYATYTESVHPSVGAIAAVNANGDLCYSVESKLTKLHTDGSLAYEKDVTLSDTLAIDITGNCYLISRIGPTNNLLTLTKYDAQGNAIFQGSIGGSVVPGGGIQANRASVDSSGNIWVVGQTNANDMQTVNPIQDVLLGDSSGFIAEFSPAGSLIFSSYFGGGVTTAGANPFTTITDLAIDVNGNAYFVGRTDTTDLLTLNALDTTPSGGFLGRVDPSGHLQYATYLGAVGGGGCAVAVDADSNMYITSATSIVKLNPSGSTVLYSVPILSSFVCSPIAIDNQQNVYTATSGQPLLNPIQSAITDIQLVGLDPNGSVIFATNFGNSSTQPTFSSPTYIGVDAAQNLYVAGIDNYENPIPLINAINGTYSICTAFGRACNSANRLNDSFVAKIGLGPGTSFSMPTGLFFVGIPVGSGSGETVSASIYNTGTTNITIVSISISGDYSQSNNCPAILAPAASCSLNVTFQPTASGARNGAITIVDDTAGSPHFIQLTGSGLTGAVSLSSSSLTFGSQAAGTSSPAQTETLTNSGGATLNISRIEVSGDFAETNNCGTSLVSGGNCTISVTFSPTATGTRTGVLTITDDAAGSPHTVNLSGTGAASGLGLGVASGGSSSATVQAGGSANYSLALGGQGMSGTVNLSCTGALTTISCNVPATANISASTASTITVTVNTTARSSASVRSFESLTWPFAVGVLGVLILPIVPNRSRLLRKRGHLLLFSLLILVCSCGGSSNAPPTGNSGTPVGTYILTVSATMGTTTQSTTLTLTVK